MCHFPMANGATPSSVHAKVTGTSADRDALAVASEICKERTIIMCVITWYECLFRDSLSSSYCETNLLAGLVAQMR